MADKKKDDYEFKEQPKENNYTFKVSAKSIGVIVAIVALIVGFAAGYMISGTATTGMATGTVISPEDGQVKAQEYIQNIIGSDSEVIISEFESLSNIYKFDVSIDGDSFASYMSLDGTYLFPSAYDLNEEIAPPESPEPPTSDVKRDEPDNPEIKTFFDSGEDICYEDGKPIIRMYASSSCGYCEWNKPMYEEVVKEYIEDGKIVAYLWEDGKNVLSEEHEAEPPEEEALYKKYGFSGVPAFIFGCKYYRPGATNVNAENPEATEEAELRVVIDDLLATV